MDLDRLNESPIGQLVPISGADARHGPYAHFAFVPAPLPPDLELDTATWGAVARATAALARLDQACHQLREPSLLIRPALWREAIDTSALEGTHGALRDLLESELPSARFLDPETREIRAYLEAARYAFDLVGTRPMRFSLLSELHRRLFDDAAAPPADIGRSRTDQVWIGQAGRPIDEARFVPPPPDDRLRVGIETWEAWVADDAIEIPPVVRAALGHYRFETLHPFADGNGRLGRLFIVLQLMQDGLLRVPALTLSPWFLKQRDHYVGHLLEVSYTGSWAPWVRFFCQAVEEQCQRVIDAAERLGEWLDEARRLVNERRWSGAIHQLLDDLLEWPVVTVADTAARYEISKVNAGRIIDHLVEIDVLAELTGRDYARVFGATGIMEVVDSI